MNLWKQADTFSRRIRSYAPAGRRRLIRVVSISLAWLLFAAYLVIPAGAEDVKLDARTANAREINNPVESPINYSAVLFKSGNRRDPFLDPIISKTKSKKAADAEMDRGPAPPGIAGTYIAQATLKGTSIQDNSRVAVVRAADNRVYFLREGDRLFDGYLKSIDTESVTLVRETKMKSGKTLTQDVIVRLRTP